jgi:hypothetical protein
MAYQTGTLNSLADIQTVIRTFLVDNGWTWDTGSSTIYKDTVFVQFVTPSGDKVLFRAKTALSGGSSAPRDVGMGRMIRDGTGNVPAVITYPATYWAFLADDEFYFVVNYDVSRYQYVMWGRSTVDVGSATGAYISGSVNESTFPSGATNMGCGIAIAPTGVASGASAVYGYRTSAPFWDDRQGAGTGVLGGYPDLRSSFLHSDLGDATWSLHIQSGANTYTGVGNGYAGNLSAVLPNTWNAESPLLPLRAYRLLTESKVALVADMQHARQCRVDNFNDAEIISIGPDQWQVFPFHRKDIAARNGGEYIDHTGTFGWAIRKVD